VSPSTSGADLGAEKFFDLKCRLAGLKPDLTVLVATVRALKYNGGAAKDQLGEENLAALEKGVVNLEKHLENIAKFQVPAVVALNRFPSDTDAELALVRERCARLGVEVALSEVFTKGGEGGIALGETVLRTLAKGEAAFRPIYELDEPIFTKIEKICREIYGAAAVTLTKEAQASLKKYEELGYAKLPVCMAKTQYSLSDDPARLGRPEGFTVTVRELRLSAGAGFLVAITGAIMTMPGLPKRPAAMNMDIDAAGKITGLF
jgi:formate--tetrahydrofolate ligase